VATSNFLHSGRSDDRYNEANPPARSVHQISSARRRSVAPSLAERRWRKPHRSGQPCDLDGCRTRHRGLRQILGNYLTVPTQTRQDLLLALGRQHRVLGEISYCTILHDYTRNCTMTTMLPDKPLLILICGPYTSGTGGDAAKIAANRKRFRKLCTADLRAGTPTDDRRMAGVTDHSCCRWDRCR